MSANLIIRLGIDEFFTRTDGVGSRDFLTEALGSTIALGDSSGTLQTQYTYEPFGYTTQSGQANTNSYKYTGREDDDSGLYYYRARYYHPRLQRFIAEDPLGFGGGDVNLYAYVRNSPTNYIDPDGTIRLPPGIGGTPPRPPIGPTVRPNPTPNVPRALRPEPQPLPSGKDLIPKEPWWLRLLKRLAGDGDNDLDITTPGVICIPMNPSSGTLPAIGNRKDPGACKQNLICFFDDGTT